MLDASVCGNGFEMGAKERQLLSYICRELCPEYSATGEDQFEYAIVSLMGHSRDDADRAIHAVSDMFGFKNDNRNVANVLCKVDECISNTSAEVDALAKRIQELTVDVKMWSLIAAAIAMHYPDTPMRNDENKPKCD